jgi:xanthine/uracil permease
MALSGAFAWAVQPFASDFPIHAAQVPLPFLILGRAAVRLPTVAHAVIPIALACMLLAAWPRRSGLLEATRRALGVIVVALGVLFVVRLSAVFQEASVITGLRAGWYLAAVGSVLTVVATAHPREAAPWARTVEEPPSPEDEAAPREAPGEPPPA